MEFRTVNREPHNYSGVLVGPMMHRIKQAVRLCVCPNCIYSTDTILGAIIFTLKPCDRCAAPPSTGAVVQLAMKLEKKYYE